MLPLRIERMQAYHLDEVLRIERATFPTPWRRQAYLSELHQNDLAHYFVGLAEGRVVGYVGMWIILDEAHVTTLAVHPSYRGKGIGERLLAYLLNEARRLGAEEVSLEVRVSNLPAQKLYRKLGFAPVGIRKRYYEDTGEDAVIMRCTFGEEPSAGERTGGGAGGRG